MKVKAVLPWAIVILSSLLTAIVPFVYMKWTLGAWLPNILPQLGPDVLYYLKQIRDVVDGHWSLGNPYFVEWADARFPGLVLPIWIGAFPAIFGLQIGGIFAFNAIVYPILMGVLSYILFRKLVGNEWFAVVCTVLTVCTLHSFLMRPILQVVYPVLVLFLLALLEVARRRDVKMKYVWLGASMSAAFYLYPHLWMPEFAAVGLFLLLCAAKREWETVKNLMVMLLCVGIVCIPQISTILSLFSNEMARLINERSGLVESHRVLPLTIFNIKYMILLVIGFGAISYKRRLHSGELLVLLCSFGIIAAALSNVITGQVMDLDTHPLWISYPLNIIAIGVLVAALWERKTRAETLVLGILLAAMVFTSGARLVRNSFSYVFNSDVAWYRSTQEYDRVFTFLREKGVEHTVLMTPKEIGNYVSVNTSNYLLFSRQAILHAVSADELLERWTVQHGGKITRELLIHEIADYAGYGVTQTRRYKEGTDPITLLGGDAFINDALVKAQPIAQNYQAYLSKYNVQYVITDALADDNPRLPAVRTRVYQDERFVIYQL